MIPTRRRGNRSGRMATPVGPERASRKSARASPMSCSRSRVSFSRQRSITRRTIGGVAGGRCSKSGGLVITDAMVSAAVSRPNTRFAVSISKSTHPNAQMSACGPTSCPFACSGDMYATVPSTLPGSVTSIETVSCSRRWTARFGKAEVEHFHRAVRPHFDIRRLQIAVHDALRMRGLERFAYLQGQPDRFIRRKRAAGQHEVERLAFDKLHDDGGDPIGLLEVEHLRDVWMAEAAQHARFALESTQSIGIARDGRRQDFQRDVTIQTRLACAINLAHASNANERDDFVRTETATGREGHRRVRACYHRRRLAK